MRELKPCEAIEILESIYPSKKQIVTGEHPEVAEALDMAIAALRRAQPANEPLTLEQLREMDREPVYMVYARHGFDSWFLSCDAQDYVHEVEQHGAIAYYHKPKEEHHEAD